MLFAQKQLGKKNIATICYRFTISWVVGVQTKAKEEKNPEGTGLCKIFFFFFPLTQVTRAILLKCDTI